MPTLSWGRSSLEALPTAPPCPSGRWLWQLLSSLISRPFWRAEHAFSLVRHSSLQPWDASQPVTQPFGKRFN